MANVNIAEAKANLSQIIERAEKGEKIVICRRNVPVVELRAVEPTSRRVPSLGTDDGSIVIHPSFFDPLDDELLDLFEGKGGGPI